MRQIPIGALLFVTCSVVAACSGDQFSSESPGSASSDPSAASGGSGDTRPPVSSPPSGTAGHASLMAGSGGVGSGTGGGSSVGSGGVAGTGTGGTSASGGRNTSGGTAASGSSAGGMSTGAGGATDEACPTGAVTFRMLPGTDLAHDYLCDAGCGTGWLTITDSEGATAFSIFGACGTATCEACSLQPCAAAACLPMPLTEKGSELVWTGTYMAKDTCGPNKLACQQPACVKPGKYRAKACAAISGGSTNGPGCVPKQDMVCATAEFEFPSTQTLKLVLK